MRFPGIQTDRRKKEEKWEVLGIQGRSCRGGLDGAGDRHKGSWWKNDMDGAEDMKDGEGLSENFNGLRVDVVGRGLVDRYASYSGVGDYGQKVGILQTEPVMI